MAQGTFKLPGGGPVVQDACPKEQPLKLATRVISYPEVAPSLETGPTTRWVGLETLVDVMLEGCKVLALADSGSQVNTMTPEFVQEQGYLVLPLDGLVNYLLHLVRLGGQCTCPFGFVIVRLQVKEVPGYDEDIVFLVVPDGSAFGKRVQLVIGTCTLAQVINVIKESEMDQISTPWVTVCLVQMVQCVMTEESHKDKNAAGQDAPATDEMGQSH